jgi:DNA-binding response OmpR family regulator
MTGSVGGLGGPHILVVEDDESLRNGLCRYLESQNHAATGVATLGAARELLHLHTFDVVVLDLNLGQEDGLDLARELALERRPPVIITSGRVDEADRILGLELGAYDYVIKPFSFRELLARIKGVLRRSIEPRRSVTHRRVARFDRWAIDLTAHAATDLDGRIVRLTVGELALLRAFLDHPNRVLLRNELLSMTRGDDAEVFSRTIDVLIARLRRKLEPDQGEPELIRTVRGEGYLFDRQVSWEILPS